MTGPFVHVIGWKTAQEIRMQISVTSVTLDVDCGLCKCVEHVESRLVIDSTESGRNEKMYGTVLTILDCMLLGVAGINTAYFGYKWKPRKGTCRP
jgi:hypothetical protein